MRNPWVDLPDRPAYVLPEDHPHVKAFNRSAADKHRLELKLLPEPFLGPRDAPLVVLMLNPGLVDTDYELHRGSYRSLLRANLGDDPDAQLHLGLRAAFANERPWWRNRFAKVIDEGHDLDELSRKVLSVEFHGYHARSWKPIPVTLPSQRFGFQVVEDAIDRGATIITTRGKAAWEVAVPRLHDYRRVVPTNTPRAAYVSPGNLGRPGFEQVLCALE